MNVADLEHVCAVADRDAAASAAAGRLTADVVGAVRDAGLFALYLPDDLGGLGLGLPDACSAIARLAEADGATGWAVMICAGPNWFAGRMSGELAALVFGGRHAVAGSGAPGTAAPATGGWRVRGRWPWCSGAPWAAWFTFAAAEAGGEAFAFAVPAADVGLEPDTWDVRGLRATASWTAALDDVFVPSDHVFRLDGQAPNRHEAIFHVPFDAFAQATMAAVSVGLTSRCLAEFTRLARDKRPTFATATLASDHVVRDRVARATAAARAASSYLERATVDLWEACRRASLGEESGPSAATLDAVRLAAAHAVEVGTRTARTVWDLSGMSVLPLASPLGRTVDDLHAVSQNAAVSAAQFASAGATLLSP